MMGTMNGATGYANDMDSLGMGFDRMSLGHHHQQPHTFRPVDHLRHTQPVDKGNRRRGVTKFFNS